jgi:hypothetical protein
MPSPTPTRPYSIPGFRIALVREPGVKVAGRPQARVPAEAAAMLAQYIGEVDREVFVIRLPAGPQARAGQDERHR